MKKIIIALATMSFLVSCKTEKKTITLKTDEDKVSYAIGLNIAKNLRSDKLDTLLNSEAIGQGIIDGVAKNPVYIINPDSAMKFLEEFSMKLREKQKADEAKKYEKNIEIGKKFLEENKKQAGIIALEDGIQYKVLKQGNGPKPTVQDVVKVHYKGTLIDGTVFDSSIDRGEPVTFPVTGVIAGWTKILQLMPVGSKWMVYIPQELAYGNQGQGNIQPYSTLIFEIELLSIEKK